MLGGTLALFAHALRVNCRAWYSHTMRFALVGILMLFLLLSLLEGMLADDPGRVFFAYIIYTNFAFITVASLVVFTTVITEEKEGQTLGLLKLAGMNPLSILLGKAGPRLLNMLFLLAVQFPFVMLAVTLGGVLPEQVQAAYVTLGIYMLLCSVVCLRTLGAARLMSFLVIGPYLAFLFFLIIDSSASGVGGTGVVGTVLEGLRWVSFHRVSVRLDRISTIGFTEGPFGAQFGSFWLHPAAWGQLAGSAISFLVTWVAFNRFTRNPNADDPGRGLMAIRLIPRTRGTGGRVWRNALLWKGFHFLTGGYIGVALRTLGYGLMSIGLAVLIWITNNGEVELIPYASSLMIMSYLVGGVESSIHVNRAFRTDIQWRTLSSLMILPTSPARIVFGKFASCLLAMLPAILVFLFAGGLLGVASAVELFGGTGSPSATGMIVFMYLMPFLCYLPLFCSVIAVFSLYTRWSWLLAALVMVTFFLTVWTLLCALSGLAMIGLGEAGAALIGGLHAALVAALTATCCYLTVAGMPRIAGEL